MADSSNLATQDNEQELDTRDVVARELDKLEQSEPGKESKDAVVEPAAEETKDSASADDAPSEPHQEDVNAGAVKEEAAQTETTPTQPVRNPFASWKKDAQTALSALPPETQKYIIERESQFHKGIQQYKEDAIQGRNFKHVVAPHADYLQQLNVTPEQAFNGLIEAEKKLRNPETRAQAFMQLAHEYNINVGDLTKVPFDPYKYQLEQELLRQKSQLEQLGQSKQMAEQAQLSQTIEQFAQNHEHFDELRETMADLLDKGLASDLDDAYAKAARLNDDVFSRMRPNTAAPQTAHLHRANEAAKAAKAAAVSVKGSPTGVTRAPEPKSTEEAVRLAMANLGL